MLEHLPTIETLSVWLLDYGSIALFILMALGIIALPVPEETLMVITGTLMSSGKLPIIPTILAAVLGSMCGITVSYFLGRTFGIYFIHKYGKWIGLKEHMIEKIHVWFERFGKWALLIGYFMPGIRHFTGFTAGTTLLDFRIFSIFAYLGAIVWVSTFLSIGYFFGAYCVDHCQNIEFNINTLILIISSAAALIGTIIYFKKLRRT